MTRWLLLFVSFAEIFYVACLLHGESDFNRSIVALLSTGLIWLAIIAIQLGTKGVKIEKQSNILGQSQKGTSSKV